MKKRMLSLFAFGLVWALVAQASEQPLCQLVVQVNPDGGASYQGATAGLINSCAPSNQDGGYGLSAALCPNIGPRMTLAFQSQAEGDLQLGDAGTAAKAGVSLHMAPQPRSGQTGVPNGVVLQPVGPGEVCISWQVTQYDGGSQTLKVFKETSAPSFTDNGFNPSSR